MNRKIIPAFFILFHGDLLRQGQINNTQTRSQQYRIMPPLPDLPITNLSTGTGSQLLIPAENMNSILSVKKHQPLPAQLMHNAEKNGLVDMIVLPAPRDTKPPDPGHDGEIQDDGTTPLICFLNGLHFWRKH